MHNIWKPCSCSPLTHRSVDAIYCWPLSLVLVFLPQALARMLFLDARIGAWLERRKVNGIRIHKHFCHAADVSHKPVDHVDRERLSDYYSQNLSLLLVGGKRVVCQFMVNHNSLEYTVKGVGALTGNNVLLSTEQIANGFLLDVREFFVEAIGKGKGYDG